MKTETRNRFKVLVGRVEDDDLDNPLLDKEGNPIEGKFHSKTYFKDEEFDSFSDLLASNHPTGSPKFAMRVGDEWVTDPLYVKRKQAKEEGLARLAKKGIDGLHPGPRPEPHPRPDPWDWNGHHVPAWQDQQAYLAFLSSLELGELIAFADENGVDITDIRDVEMLPQVKKDEIINRIISSGERATNKAASKPFPTA